MNPVGDRAARYAAERERRNAEFVQRMEARHRRERRAILAGGAVGLLLTLVIGLTVTIADQVTAVLMGLGVMGACVFVALQVADRVERRPQRGNPMGGIGL